MRCDVAAPALHCMPHEATNGEGKAASSERASEREHAFGVGIASLSLKTRAAQSYPITVSSRPPPPRIDPVGVGAMSDEIWDARLVVQP